MVTWNRRYVSWKKVFLVVLWGMIILFAVFAGYKEWINADVTGIDAIKIEGTWDGEDTQLFSCINEIILAEEWSSVALSKEENEFILSVNEKVRWESMLWRFVSQQTETSFQVTSIELMRKDECILAYVGEELVNFFYMQI